MNKVIYHLSIDTDERKRDSQIITTPLQDNFYYFYLKLENCGWWAIICLKLQIKDLKCLCDLKVFM